MFSRVRTSGYVSSEVPKISLMLVGVIDTFLPRTVTE